MKIYEYTEIFKENNIKGNFRKIYNNENLRKIVFTGEIDVLFLSDQAASIILANDSNWTIIGRGHYHATALFVSPHSNAEKTSDLRGGILVCHSD
jgi:hypothetical protein